MSTILFHLKRQHSQKSEITLTQKKNCQRFSLVFWKVWVIQVIQLPGRVSSFRFFDTLSDSLIPNMDTYACFFQKNIAWFKSFRSWERGLWVSDLFGNLLLFKLPQTYHYIHFFSEKSSDVYSHCLPKMFFSS